MKEQFGNITLINDDCMNILRGLPDNAFDLAIVDSPYGSVNIQGGYTSGKGGGVTKQKTYNQNIWEHAAPSEEYFNELIRVSANQIIWGANHFISKIAIDSSCWIVWDKDNGKSSFADCELAYTSFPTAVRRFKYKWQGMLQENMKNKEVRIHPTQKPVALYKWLLHNYAKEGDTILDTHLGSGSNCIACHDMGFTMTGIELDKEYYDGAKQRLINHQLQQKLF